MYSYEHMNICTYLKKRRARERQKNRNYSMKKYVSNRETYIHTYTIWYMLLTHRFVCFIRAHKHIHKGTKHTSASSANRWKKYRNNSHSFCLSLSLSLSQPLLLDSLLGFSHLFIYPSFSSSSSSSYFAPTIRSHYFFYNNDSYHTRVEHFLWSLSSTITQAVNETSVPASFCFVIKKKRRENRLSWRCRLLFYYWAFYLFLSLLCVCMAGRYCFRLIATVVVDFSPFSFHAHSHMLLVFFLYFIAKKKRETFSLFIHTYIFILILLSFLFSSSSSSSYVITHPCFLLLAYLSFLWFNLVFFFFASLFSFPN